jgi:hypothetical protein
MAWRLAAAHALLAVVLSRTHYAGMLTRSSIAVFASVLAGLCATSCDGLSTRVISKSSQNVMFRWHNKDEADWSTAFRMPVDRPQALLRAPFHNMGDIGVKDGNRWMHVEPVDMARFHSICDPAPQCLITYFGSGELRVTRTTGF